MSEESNNSEQQITVVIYCQNSPKKNDVNDKKIQKRKRGPTLGMMTS